MALYQPTNISPSSLNGTGVIDATKDLTVSWQINGYGGMIGWQIQIMQNDAESTLVYDSTMLHSERYNEYAGITYNFIYGKDETGDNVPFSWTIPAEDLAGKVVNGYANGYKLRINQQYINESDEYVTVIQNSPVYFVAQAAWSWDYTWAATQTQREPLFTAFNTSRIPVLWNRWRLAGADTDNVLYDSGRIYTDNIPNYTAKNLLDGNTYHVRLDGQNVNGATADTGWFRFTVQYVYQSNEHIQCKAYYVAGMPCTYVTLEADSNDSAARIGLFSYYGWGVYRVKTGSNLMELAAVIPNGQYSFYDFGIKNNTEYTYEVFSNFIGSPAYHYTSNPIKMSNYWNWSLVEAVPRTNGLNWVPDRLAGWTPNISNTMYHVTKVYQFQGNIKSGNISNENTPFVADNFTGYPIVQKSSRIGLSGTLKGLTGLVENAEYKDSIGTIDDLMTMSARETVKFLRDRKGNLRRVEIDAPTSKNTSDENREQAVEIQIPWAETGDASECQVVSTLDDGLLMHTNDFTPGTGMYLYAAQLSPGIYKWTAKGINTGSITLTKAAGTSFTEIARIDAATLSGTFTLNGVYSLYATGSSASVTASGFLLQRTGDYEEEVSPTPGVIRIPQNYYGTQIAILKPGTTYDWEYTSATIPDGASVKLVLVQQVGSNIEQTVKAMVESGSLSGTFDTSGDAESATLWVTTSTSDAVTITGWELTADGEGGGGGGEGSETPAVRTNEVNYLLYSGMTAGTWQYGLDNVAGATPLYGRVTSAASGDTIQEFAIGNSANGTVTLSQNANLFIYNPSAQEYTIGAYSVVQTAAPEDPDTGTIVETDLTVQGNLLGVSTTGTNTLKISAESVTAPTEDKKVLIYFRYINAETVGYSQDINGKSFFFQPASAVADIAINTSMYTVRPPVTLTNFKIEDTVAGTTLYSAASLPLNYAQLLTSGVSAGSFTVTGTSMTGSARMLFCTESLGNWKNINLTPSNITTGQTVEVAAAVQQIYVVCPYDEECVITGLKIVKN